MDLEAGTIGVPRPGGPGRGAELAAAFRYARALPSFLRRRLSGDDCRRIVSDGLAARTTRFLYVLEHGIYGRRNVYRRLLDEAGVELGDLRALVEAHGIEATLQRLHDAGVRLTLQQFKGLAPIERNGWSYTAGPADFDNPLARSLVTGRGTGSRGTPRRLIVNLDDLEHSTAYTGLFLSAFELRGRPTALWRPLPPGQAGLANALQLAKVGQQLERWFSQNGFAIRRGATAEIAYTLVTIGAARRAGLRIPMPEHVPLSDPLPVARWLADRAGAGQPAHLSATVGAAVRVCAAARDNGLDIDGSFLRVGGEPLTEAKATVFAEAGCTAACHYTTSEVGRIGVACAEPSALDDVHIAIDKLAVIQRERELSDDVSVAALCVTTIAPTVRRLMLNVETDDYGVLEHRSCGCVLGELGLTLHLHSIRNYEKLTSDGMNFLGPVLLRLVDDVLPRRFGGTATDYQLVEEEIGGLSKVDVLVSPRIGPIDEWAVVETVLSTLSVGRSSARMMAELWRDGGTVRVVRRAPYETGSGKILPLHLPGRGRGATRVRIGEDRDLQLSRGGRAP